MSPNRKLLIRKQFNAGRSPQCEQQIPHLQIWAAGDNIFLEQVEHSYITRSRPCTMPSESLEG